MDVLIHTAAAGTPVSQGHRTGGGPAGQAGTAQQLSGFAGSSRCGPPRARRRRPKLRIVRFRAGPKAHSLRWALAPVAALRFPGRSGPPIAPLLFPARFIRHRRRFAGKLSPPNPLRSRWRLCRLTDAACPLRVLRWASAGAPVTASASQWGGRQCAVGLRPVRTAHRRREPPFRGAPGEHPRPLLSPHFFGKKWGRPPRRRRRGRFR